MTRWPEDRRVAEGVDQSSEHPSVPSRRVQAADAEPLRSPDVGLRVIRSATVRGAGYGVGVLLTAVASVFLLRHLGVADFGRYMTVASLVAIVGGLTDAGLSAIGGRDLALRGPGEERERLLTNLLGLRLVLTLLGALAAVMFALAAGYENRLVLGTALAGIGLVLLSSQTTMTLPLSVDLRIGRLTVSETTRQAAMLIAIALLVAAGAGLFPFFAVSIIAGLVTLAVTPALVSKAFVWRPTFDSAEWSRLIRETLPLAASVVVGVFYFRLLIILTSVLGTAVATGLFATSFRVSEILYSLATLAVTIALPVLTVAADESGRLRYILQRMVEVSLIAACYLVIVVVILAEPVLRLLAGDQYRDAAPVLRIQVFALVPVFLTQVLVVGLISIRRPFAQLLANGVAVPVMLAMGLVLIPRYGAIGASTSALVAEAGYGLMLLVLFVRSDPSLRPNFRFLWKIAIAAGLGAAAASTPGLPPVGAAAAATVVYFTVLLLTRAVPREVLDAFVFRSRST
jgi:O-antigen/teichoic acid export membrane protein